MSISRRVFLRNGALAVVGTAALPFFLTRAACGAVMLGANHRLIVVFQRGAADGLNMVVPHGEDSYYAMRPSINIPRNSLFDLDGFFGLHPSLSALQPLWEQHQLAIVHAVGSPHPTRSHFDAQDFMESGMPGVKATEDGWLNRALRFSHPHAQELAFRAIALGPSLPRSLSGSEPTVAINNTHRVGAGDSNLDAVAYSRAADCVPHRTVQEMIDAVKMLKSYDPRKYTPIAGTHYPQSRFGDSMKQLAQVIKSNLEVRVCFADIGGWDHHVNEGNTQGQLATLLRDFSQSLAAFWTDLGDLAENTILVTMSEFGRTARENRNCGTDHGHGNVMFVIGGAVKGGKVYGRWPGLDQSQLYEGRDLAVTTDFRSVLGEAVFQQLGSEALIHAFPGFENGAGFPGIFGAQAL
jgi:uncharacterized protein (DUF1501 family)